MTLSDLSTDRPILTWMMILALVVFGVLGYNRLGVDQFPNMEFPVLTVQANMEGASPEGMEEDVVDVLEEYLNTIGGVRSIRSTKSAVPDLSAALHASESAANRTTPDKRGAPGLVGLGH